MSFAPSYLQSPLLADFTSPPPPPPSKSGLKLVCNVNIVYGNLKSENPQDNPVHEFRFCYLYILGVKRSWSIKNIPRRNQKTHVVAYM
jgi:hypothetical protein